MRAATRAALRDKWLMGTNKLMADLCRCGMARDRHDADVVAMRTHSAMYAHAVSKQVTVRTSL